MPMSESIYDAIGVIQGGGSADDLMNSCAKNGYDLTQTQCQNIYDAYWSGK